METRMYSFILLSLLFLSSVITLPSSATDSISSGQSLPWNHTLISQGGNFELGIFQPGNSSNYYIGIWYKKISVENKTYVWVANRNTPLTDPTSSELKLLENGNLVLLNQSNNVVWSTNSTSDALNSSQAVLRDDGNLVIRNGPTQTDVLWQSFDHQTDTFLSGGKIGYNHKTGESQQITSWRSANDPSEGLYSLLLDPDKKQLVIQWNKSVSYWTSGGWNGKRFSGIPEMLRNYIFHFSYVDKENESYFTCAYINTSFFSRLVIDEWGQFQQLVWDNTSRQWFLSWSQPRQQCSVYGYCGFFSVCENRTCQCMDGFTPQSANHSNISGYFSGNCVKENLLQCGKDDTFTRILNMRSPRNQIDLDVTGADECKEACLSRCPCTAYAYNGLCSIWTENLQVAEGDEGPRDIYVRRSAPMYH